MSDKTLLPPELEIASIIAPVVRSMKGRKRVHVVDRETGEVKGVIDQELVIKILAKSGVEFGVVTDPKSQETCAGWGGPCPSAAKPPASAKKDRAIRMRAGRPWRCARCRNARTQATMTPEQIDAQKERMRHAARSRTPEQIREAGRRGYESAAAKPGFIETCRNSMSTEQRRANGRKANERMTAEARQRANDALRKLTPEQRRKGRAKQEATLGSDGRTAIGHKAWATTVARGKRKPLPIAYCIELDCNVIVSEQGRRCQPHAYAEKRRRRKGDSQ